MLLLVGLFGNNHDRKIGKKPLNIVLGGVDAYLRVFRCLALMVRSVGVLEFLPLKGVFRLPTGFSIVTHTHP